MLKGKRLGAQIPTCKCKIEPEKNMTKEKKWLTLNVAYFVN